MKINKHQQKLNIVLAILIAFIAWAYVIYTTDPSTTKTVKAVPIEFTSQRELAEESLAIKSSDIETVDVLVEGKRSKVGRITADDIKATVNLAEAGRGENVIDINLTVPSSVSVTNKSAKQATVFVEDLASKEVFGRAEYTDTADQNTEPYVIEQSDEVFRVSGAKSLIDRVEYVRIPLVREKLSGEEKTFSVKTVAVSATGTPVNYIAIEPSVESVTAVDSAVKVVKLNLNIDIVDNEYCHVTYSAPESVTIKGQANVVNSINSIDTMTVSTEGVDESQDVELEYNLPEGVQIANASKGAVVHLKVVPYETKTIHVSVSDIEINNLSERYNAEFTENIVVIKVTGLGVDIKPLTAADFKLSVNAKNMGEGTYEPEFKVTTDAAVYKAEPVDTIPYLRISEK